MAEPTGVEEVEGVRVLALCGESVLMEGIEASLRDREGVEIALLDTSQPGAVQALDRLNPNIIIFDLNPSQLSCVIPFLTTHTDVLLIGLEINSDQALFLTGEWRRLPTVADLMQVIEARTRRSRGNQRIPGIQRIQVKNDKQL